MALASFFLHDCPCGLYSRCLQSAPRVPRHRPSGQVSARWHRVGAHKEFSAAVQRTLWGTWLKGWNLSWWNIFTLYKNKSRVTHCWQIPVMFFQAILDVMVNLQFTLVETLWKTFWRFSQSQADATLPVWVAITQRQTFVLHYHLDKVWVIKTVCLGSHDESEKRLPKSCLVLLCKYEPVLRWSRDCDNSLYQGLVEILIPDVLRPIPSKARQ